MICNEFNLDSETVVLASDFHIGNKNTDMPALKKMILDVKKNGYNLVVLGDLCECISSRDKRFDMGTVAPEFLGENMIGRQYKSVEKLLNPIADQVLMIHSGNHDQSVAKYCHIDMVKDLCESLGTTYSEYTALSRLSYCKRGKKFSYNLYSTHGHAAGRLRGGKVNSLEGLASHIDFDIAAAGHSHDLFYTSQQRMFQTKFGHLGLKTQYFCNTGSFLRGVVEGSGVSYPEQAGYRPLKIGYLKVRLNPREYGVSVEEVIL